MRISIRWLLLVWLIAMAWAAPTAQASEDAAETAEPSAPAETPFSVQETINSLLGVNESGEPLNAWFWGRFHPVVVHLPVGLLMGLFLMELWAAVTGKMEEFQTAAAFLAVLSAVFAILSVISGFLLALGGAYDSGLVVRHTWLGVAAAVLAVLVSFGKNLYNRTGDLGVGTIYYLTLLAAVAVMGFGAYDGTQITHGRGYLTEYMPASFRSLLESKREGGDEPPPAAPVVPETVPAARPGSLAPGNRR